LLGVDPVVSSQDMVRMPCGDKETKSPELCWQSVFAALLLLVHYRAEKED
jgi:hypothetical protein